MSETPTWDKISTPVGSTTSEFGGTWANLLSDYFNGINIGLTDASKIPIIGTLTRFKPDKLGIYDADQSHYVVIAADDIDTGPVRKFKIRRMNTPFEEDYAVLEGMPQTLLNKTIDGDLNTIIDIANASIKTGAAIAYSKLNLSNSIVNADINSSAAISYSKLNISNSIVAGDITSNAVTTTKILDTNVTLAKLAADSVDSSKIVADSIVNSDVNSSAAIATTKLADSANFVLTTRANTFGDLNNTFKDNRLLINNPADTFAYTIIAAAIAANRNVTLPLLTGNDTFVTEAFTQVLTNKTIDADLNTITNIENADIKAAAGIVTTKLADSTNFILKTLDNSFGAHYQDFTKMTTPSNPGINDIRMYVDTTDTHLKIRNNAGTVVDLHTGGGGGATNLDALTDVDLTTVAPVNGDVLTYTTTGTKWVPSAPPGAGGSVTASSVTTFTNKTIDADGTGNVISNIENADIKAAAGIVTTKLADSTNFVLTTRANTFGAFNQTFPTSRLLIGDSDASHAYLIAGSNLAANRTVTLPLLTGNDIFVTEAFTQTLSNKTLTSPIISSINNTGTLTLPTATTTLIGTGTTDTLTNKTINATNNTITDTSTAAGDLLISNGTKFTRIAKGSDGDILQVVLGSVTWGGIGAHSHGTSAITSGSPFAVSLGGTGKSTITQHALIKGGATNTYSEITAGTNGDVLTMVAGTPAWAVSSGGGGITASSTDTLTNKTIDADTNTLTNIENADIKAAAGIVTSKLADSANFILKTLDNSFGAHYQDFTKMTAPGNPGVNDIRLYVDTTDTHLKIRNNAGAIVDLHLTGGAAHATSHKSGGSDVIKLDELAAPTNITTLNADVNKHGLMPKLQGEVTKFMRADGTWSDLREKSGIVVPLYIYPNIWVGPPYNWTPIITAKTAYPDVDFLCIINVNNGPDVTLNTDFQTGIAQLKAVGVKFIGYVYTLYGVRSLVDVKADIDLWYSLYGADSIDGIHFDEFVNVTGYEAYYQELYDYVKTKGGRGIVYVNPGTGMPETYMPTFDICCVWENSTYPTTQELRDFSFYPRYISRKQISLLVHTESTPDYTYLQNNADYLDYVYLTDDVMPNPYDALPTYLQTLTQTLSNIYQKALGVVDLDGLRNVNISSPADNQSLTYDSATSKWINETVAGGGGITASSTDTLTNKTINADGTGNVITNIENADIKAAAGIVTTKLADSVNFVLTNRTNTFGAFDQIFPTSRLLIGDSNASHNYIIAGSDLTANRTVTLPLLTGNDTLVTEAFGQTLSNKTLATIKTSYLSVTTTPVTLSATADQMVKVDASGGARTVNLPAVSGNSGLFYTIIKSDSSANAVTIDGASSETINGATTYLLTAQYQSVVLRCDGAAWFTQVNTSERTGTATATANGSTTIFNIAHGLGSTPYRSFVECSTHTGTFTRTEDATNIVITYGTAPPGSPATIKFHWSAVL